MYGKEYLEWKDKPDIKTRYLMGACREQQTKLTMARGCIRSVRRSLERFPWLGLDSSEAERACDECARAIRRVEAQCRAAIVTYGDKGG